MYLYKHNNQIVTLTERQLKMLKTIKNINDNDIFLVTTKKEKARWVKKNEKR